MRPPCWVKGLVAPILAAALIATACTNGAPSTAARSPGSATRAPGVTPTLPSPFPLDTKVVSEDPIVQVVKRVTPAVVNVTTSTPNPNAIFGGGQEGHAVGTGFVIREDGVIVTNFHVVEGALNIKVTMLHPMGGTSRPA